ncbi:serine hydrolase domain-containing protein [Achromobacter insuavis]
MVAYLKQRIAYDLDAQRVPGLSIAIVDDQRTVWSSGFGYADSARHRNATGDTLYRVGAISKVVTAAGVLRAADDGRLSLDIPAAQALPQSALEPRRAAMHWMGTYPFTVRRLLALRPDTLEDTMGRAAPTWATPCSATWWRTPPTSLRRLRAPHAAAAAEHLARRLPAGGRQRRRANCARPATAAAYRGSNSRSRTRPRKACGPVPPRWRVSPACCSAAAPIRVAASSTTNPRSRCSTWRRWPTAWTWNAAWRCRGWRRPAMPTTSPATRCATTAARPKPSMPAGCWRRARSWRCW